MNLEQFIFFFDNKKDYLLGEKSHKKMMPEGRFYPDKNNELIHKAKKASVLILVFEQENKLYFPLTLRKKYEGEHSNQISLPGGKYDKTDKNLEETAKRETFEEIGIKQEKIKIIAELTSVYIQISNFLVTPFIGIFHKNHEFKIQETEVEKLIITPLEELIEIKSKKTQIKNKNYSILAPYMNIQNQIVWGATAMILQEFKDIINFR